VPDCIDVCPGENDLVSSTMFGPPDCAAADVPALGWPGGVVLLLLLGTTGWAAWRRRAQSFPH
jgi:hypothetical protein